VERLVIADGSLEASRALATALPDGRADSDRIDASKVDSMVDAFTDVDVVMNLVLPRFNLRIMDACLKAGAHYVDAATDLALAKEKPGEPVTSPPEFLQLAYDASFREAGLIGLLAWDRTPASRTSSRGSGPNAWTRSKRSSCAMETTDRSRAIRSRPCGPRTR